MNRKLRKNSKIQKPHSNRHGQSITNKDIKRINNSFNSKCLEYEELDLSELQAIKDNNFIYNGKKLTGSYKKALEFTIELKQTKLKDEKTN